MQNQEIINKYIPQGFKAEQDGRLFSFSVLAGQLAGVCRELYFTKRLPLKTIVATDERKEAGGYKIRYIFGLPKENLFIVPVLSLSGTEEFPSIAKEIHEAAAYENLILTFFGLNPVGHPAPGRILLHETWPEGVFPLRKDFDWQTRPAEAKGTYQFQEVQGEGIYEIPVGPVHAGIIEPGHFRFSMAGEEMVSLEPKLGFKHKGIEKLFEVLPLEKTVHLSERISGDTSFTHSLAYCQALEELSGIEVPARAGFLRVIFSELERLANHFNDIGFIMLDAGYSFGGANGGRLREVIMQWNERLSGSRFLRGVNQIGGVSQDIEPSVALELASSLKCIKKDFNEVIEISERSASLLNRLESTGILDQQAAIDHGAIGIPGRAIGLAHDARLEYPYAAYEKFDFPVSLETAGDVRARLYVRIKEVRSSFEILAQALENLPDGLIRSAQNIEFRKNSQAIGVTEGWRGDIVYFVATDAAGKITRVSPRDPSFINWRLMEHTVKGNIVADFPMINKSYNLSYSGNDL